MLEAKTSLLKLLIGGLSFISLKVLPFLLIENRDEFLSKGISCTDFRDFVVSALLRKSSLEVFSCDQHRKRNERALVQSCTNFIINNTKKEFKDSVQKSTIAQLRSL